MTISSFWSPCVVELEPYVPGEQPSIANLIKLNTNENPYPPSPKAIEAIQRAATERLELYPDPTSFALREAIAQRHGLTIDQVFVGNGSDEVLGHSFFAFFQHVEPLLLSDVTYGFYKVYAQLYGINVEVQLVDARLCVDIDALTVRAAQGCGGIVVANPNAPTGIGLPLSELERLLAACSNRVVLVDEAYVDFGGVSALPLIERYPNLLVTQTFSKSRSLAGLRVGFACGQAHLIDALHRVKDSFNSYPLDRLASAGAIAALEDEGHFEMTRHRVIDARERLVQHLTTMGFQVLPSQANFVFVRHPQHDAAALAAALREHSILVRHFQKPRIAQWLRITIGTLPQCVSLVNALKLVLRV